MTATLVLNAAGMAIALAASHVLLRHAAGLGLPLLAPKRLVETGFALAIYFAIFLYYSMLLERLPLSRLYPIYTGLSVVAVFIAGALLFGESIRTTTIMGVVLVVAGVYLIAGEP